MTNTAARIWIREWVRRTQAMRDRMKMAEAERLWRKAFGKDKA